MSEGMMSEDLLQGLTSEQVERRRSAGLVNYNTDVKTKSLRQILAEHTLTLFNGVNFALALPFCGIVTCRTPARRFASASITGMSLMVRDRPAATASL